MKAHQLLHEFHSIIQGQLQAFKEAWRHTRATVFMAMEGPSVYFVVTLGGGFGDVVQDGGPSQPKICRHRSNIVQYLQRVKEVVFVRAVTHILNSVKSDQFREELLKKP